MTKKRKLFFALLVLLLCLIWGNSLLSREISGAISDFFQVNINHALNVSTDGEVNSVPLRKLAHFAEFSVLGILLSVFLRGKIRRFPKAFLLGVAVASLDETIQIFSGRGNSLFDVMLDCAGVIFGIFALFLFEKYKKGKEKDLP